MAATVIINEFNGAAVKTDKTSGTVRFKNADNATVDLLNPLIVPTADREYSFEKWLRLEVTGGTYTQLSNLQFYSDGTNSFGTGIKVWYWSASEFSNPSVPSESNDPPVQAGSPAEVGQDLFALTSGSPGDLDVLNPGSGPDGVFDGGSPGGEGDIGDFLVLVMEVETNASQGLLASETLTVSFDEI